MKRRGIVVLAVVLAYCTLLALPSSAATIYKATNRVHSIGFTVYQGGERYRCDFEYVYGNFRTTAYNQFRVTYSSPGTYCTISGYLKYVKGGKAYTLDTANGSDNRTWRGNRVENATAFATTVSARMYEYKPVALILPDLRGSTYFTATTIR